MDLGLDELVHGIDERAFTHLYAVLGVPLFSWRKHENDIVLVACNEAANAEAHGRAADFVGRTAADIFTDRPDLVACLERALVERAPVVLETDYATRGTREIRRIRFAFVPVGPRCVVQVAERTGGDRQALAETRTSEARLRSAMALARAGHWVYRVADDEFLFNDNFYRIFGCTGAEVGGYTMRAADYAERFCHPDDAHVVAEEIGKALRSESSPHLGRLEHRIKLANGEVGYMEVRYTVVRDDGGGVQLFGVNQDITDRKRAEHAFARRVEVEQLMLGLSEECLSRPIAEADAFIEQSLSTVAELVGAEGIAVLRVADDGEAWSVVHAWPALDDRSLHGAMQALGDALPRLRAHHAVLLDGDHAPPRAVGAELVWPSPGRRSFVAPVFVHGQLAAAIAIREAAAPRGPLSADVESVVRFLADAVVTTMDRREQEAAREKLHEQLAQSQKLDAVGTLASGLAHEMNNVLAVVLGLGTMLLQSEETPPTIRSELTDIVEAAARGKSLVEDLLGFARKRTDPRTVCLLNGLVERITDVFQRSMLGKVDVRLQLEPWSTRVHCDQGLIQQTLLNLLINAKDASDGRGTISVHTATRTLRDGEIASLAAGTYAQIEVRDEGVGMTEEVRRRALDPFFTTKPVGEGTGLGLALAYGAVTSHGGALTIESTPGSGTTVRILLPTTDRALDASAPPPLRASARTNRHLLVVDDDRLVRTSTKRLLERGGYSTVVVDDGLAALEVYARRSEDFDLVILDVSMPEIDGIECFARLRAIDPTVRVLFATGRTDLASDLNEAIAAGALGVIAKPFSMDELLSAVAHATAR